MTTKLLLVPAALLAFSACSASPSPSLSVDQASCVNFSNALHYGDPSKGPDRSEITRLAGRPEDPELARHHAAMVAKVGKRLPWSIEAVQFADRCDALFNGLMIDRDKL